MNQPQDIAAVGLCPERWQRSLDLAGEWCRTDKVPAIGIHCGRSTVTTGTHLFGRQRVIGDSSPIRDDAIFLVASITKPIVATGALLLIERGQLLLGDRVPDLLPEFRGRKKNGIEVRHLLTHTSGLPDMLPNNRELRRAHAPLSEFVKATCSVETAFAPGRGVKYQSMGIAVLGAIIEKIAGKPTAEFLKEEIFDPLGMRDTVLGAPPEWFEGSAPIVDRIAEIRVPSDEKTEPSWDWNSPYWRMFGATWGGLLTTPDDLARFARMMLGGGTYEGRRILSATGVAAATRNQLNAFPLLSDSDRNGKPWGLGWRLNWPGQSESFGDLLGPHTYGHWGATGTLMWIDPDRDAFAIILTTQPQEPHGRFLAKLSNAISAAFE